jgi:hypothetical protein
MTDGTIVIGGDSVGIPNGTYPATLTGIVTLQSDAYGEFRRWEFQLENGSTVDGASSMNTGAKSKGGRWIAALLGRKPEKGETVNVIGKACLVVVQEGKNEWPSVFDVLPPLAAASAPAASTEPAALAELP